MDGDWSGLRLLYGGIQNRVALVAAPNPANWTPALALVGLSRIWSDSNHPYWIIRGSTLQTYKVDNTDKFMEEKVCSITLHWQSGPHGILAVQIATG